MEVFARGYMSPGVDARKTVLHQNKTLHIYITIAENCNFSFVS